MVHLELKDAKYFFAYIAPIAAFAGLYFAGPWSLGAVYVAFVLIPLLEVFLPGTQKNLNAEAEREKGKSSFFDYLLYLNVPILFALLWYFFTTLNSGGLETYEKVMMTFNIGIMIGTIGINVAHELGHRQTRYEQLLSKMLLMTALYMHFNIEHNRGHHKNVATDEDPASAKAGQSLYAFWIRSTFFSYLDAWKLEAQRLRKVNKKVLSLHNEMIWFQLIQGLYLLTIGMLFGWAMIAYAVWAAVIGILLLETVNYIEHYGLRRKKLPTGRYEHVAPHHSWNSNHELGRIFLYELTRHSDHHYKATRKYQVLRHFDESPQLPWGYPMAMIIALVPPLWFKLMDEKVKVASKSNS